MKTFLFFEPKAKGSPPPPPRCDALYTFNFSLRREYFSKDYIALKHIININYQWKLFPRILLKRILQNKMFEQKSDESCNITLLDRTSTFGDFHQFARLSSPS